MAAIATYLVKARTWLAQHRKWVLAAVVILALAYPYAVRSYWLSLGIEVLIFAIFAISLDLLLGYTGLASFGHAAFFGLGAYIVAYVTSRSELALGSQLAGYCTTSGWLCDYVTSRSDLALGLTNNLLISLPLTILGTALIALVIGFFALRTIGIYFLMITLAFAQMLFSIAIRWSSVTGGSDGLTGVPRPAIGLGSLSYTFDSRVSYYYLVLAFSILSWWLLRRIVNSPFGWTLRGIRENEQRMRALGYNTFRFKMASFVISGAFAGLAGMLLVQFFRHAAPENLYWTMSGQVMVMLIVGGTGTLIGPILGAAVVRLFPQFVSSYTERWETLLGLLFILFVLFAPKGIMGILRARPGSLLLREKKT